MDRPDESLYAITSSAIQRIREEQEYYDRDLNFLNTL